jgi:hypothetical protein
MADHQQVKVQPPAQQTRDLAEGVRRLRGLIRSLSKSKRMP